MHLRGLLYAAATVLCVMAASEGRPAAAQDADFKGKTIRILAGSQAGSMYDNFGRLMARHLGRYLSGNPTVIVTDMEGASGVRATNYLYEVAPKDGTVLATFNKAMPFYQVMGEGGVRFKAQELSWIGALTQANDVLTVWHTTGVNTIEDAKRREIVMGALSYIGTNWTYPALLNAMIGTKFKVVTGYRSGIAVDHAMEQGEVEGRGSNQWSAWKAIHPDWLRDKKIVVLVQIGLRKEADLPDVPLLTELAQNDEQRRMLQFVSEAQAMDAPLAGPPGIPPAISASLRGAFDTMVKDAGFRADADKLAIDLGPLTGDEVGKLVTSIITTSPVVVDKVRTIIAPPNEANKSAPPRQP
jgi:tripartite-type tricarboxylate transporter receptor subunit TctC